MFRRHSAFYAESAPYALPHCKLPQVFAQHCAQFLSRGSDYFPALVFAPPALRRSSGMAGECQALCGEKEVVSEDKAGFFPWGTRVAGREDAQETGVDRVHLAQAEPSFQRKLFLLGLWGLVCTTSQVRGLNLSKTRQILNFLRESNFISPEAGAFLWNWGSSKQ